MDATARAAFVEGADLPDGAALARAPGLGDSVRALLEALLARDAAKVGSLLAHDPALGRASVDGAAVAELAVATGDAELLDRALAQGVPADPAADGAPLVLALHARGPELAIVLLTRGASPTPAAAPLAAFRAAIALGSSAGVRLLLDWGADPDATGPLARRPLHVALDMEQFAIAELLLDRGADPWAVDAGGANLATAATTPMVTASLAEAAAQGRLLGRARALGWPEPFPSPRELVERAGQGKWPPLLARP